MLSMIIGNSNSSGSEVHLGCGLPGGILRKDRAQPLILLHRKFAYRAEL